MHTQVGGLMLPVDHIAFATADIGAATGRLDELRLPHTRLATISWTDAGGHHETGSVSAMLADGYLDVIELPEIAADTISATGVVVSTGDLDGVRRQLMAQGVRCAEPYRITRRFPDSGATHSYDVVGTNHQHPCGLALAVIHNLDAPMTNDPTSTAAAVGVAVAAARLGVELEPAP